MTCKLFREELRYEITEADDILAQMTCKLFREELGYEITEAADDLKLYPKEKWIRLALKLFFFDRGKLTLCTMGNGIIFVDTLNGKSRYIKK